jgi:hypothetical protein
MAMPSSSKKQARFVEAEAKRGAKWAKEWRAADHARGTKQLPTRSRRKKKK